MKNENKCNLDRKEKINQIFTINKNEYVLSHISYN